MPRRPQTRWVEFDQIGSELVGSIVHDVDRDDADDDHPRVINERNEWTHLLPAEVVEVRSGGAVQVVVLMGGHEVGLAAGHSIEVAT
jgi:hypothetical protein